jgi:C2H2 transcription facotor
MATFRPVNTTLAPDSQGRNGEETAPTTPRPSTAPSIQPAPMHRDDATTPTRANFGALANQRPLPTSPFPAAITVPSNDESANQKLHRGDSHYSAQSKESEDVEMGDSDDGEDGSDDESVNADGTKSNKKKKSQRFYCTDFPPCGLSFTRSEHLARHIR